MYLTYHIIPTLRLRRLCLLLGLLLVSTVAALAQNDRTFIRQGNRQYRARKWTAAEVQYRKAIARNANNPQAVYNLGCALMMQQKDSLAMQQFAKSADLQTTNKIRRAKSFHNMGVIMQNHQEFAKAIECYKMALRNNPQDNETRYNLALCQHQLKNQKNRQNQNKNKSGNDKNNKDKQNKKNKDQNKDQNKQKNNQNKDKNNQSQKPEQDKMSRDNAEQLLNAAVQQEKATKQKMQKAMSQPRRRQYDKNW
uniref:tetratricopeptide repeat protein n=1 Tax=Prevotella sp. TaxID=59823 RepID=UPI0025CD7CA2